MDVDIDGLKFTFEDDWLVSKFDDWSFYRNQFQSIRPGIKALDLLAMDSNCDVLWLIEVKDYRTNKRTKPSKLHEEVADKVLSTLAALMPATKNANAPEEQSFAEMTLGVNKLKVVLHIEQPQKPSKLFPKSVEKANLKQKLKQTLKPVDPHPLVLDKNTLGAVPWDVN